MNEIWNGHCLKLMPNIPSQSVNLILCDLPFEMTNNTWDSLIPMEDLWKEYRRIIKATGAIVLNSQGIFTAKLILSAPDLYKYSYVWQKNRTTGFLNAKKQPLRAHEDIVVFYDKQPTYHPQKTTGHSPVHTYYKNASGFNYGKTKGVAGGGSTERYPTTIIKIATVNRSYKPKNGIGRTHPTEKPVELGEYLIKTFTNPGDTILDNACGTGAYLIAAKNLNRNFIGIELDPTYYEIAKTRLNQKLEAAPSQPGKIIS